MDWDKFSAISPDITLWQILDSQFLTTTLAAAFSVLLFHYQKRLKEDNEDATDIVKYKDDVELQEQQLELETQVAAPNLTREDPFREAAASIVDEAKKNINDRIAKDLDGRHGRTTRLDSFFARRRWWPRQ